MTEGHAMMTFLKVMMVFNFLILILGAVASFYWQSKEGE